MNYICVVKHSEIKEHIIETAAGLFYSQGYNATGINEIIAEAGIAKATLYNHFKSKEELCLAYLKYKNDVFINDISQYCEARKSGKTQVLGIFDFLLRFYKDKDFNGCWCIKTIAEIPRDNELIRSEIRKQKKLFIGLIADLVAANLNVLTKAKVKSLSRKIYLLYESAVGESHLHGDEWPIRTSKNLCADIIS